MNTYSQEQLTVAADRVFHNIAQLFGYYAWIARIAPSLESRKDGEPGHLYFVLAQNSIVDGFLINLRRLNEFFTKYPENRNPKFADDLRASDFGFQGERPFLDNTDMDELHKRIAHSTSRAVIHGDASFEALKATEFALGHSFEFLKHLCSSLYAKSPEKTEQAMRALQMLRGMLDTWRNEAETAMKDASTAPAAQTPP